MFLPECWYPLARGSAVRSRLASVTLDGQPFALFRDAQGHPHAIDLTVCPHRGVPLSDGQLRDGTLECPYHGWRFDAQGRCMEDSPTGTGGAHCAGSVRSRGFPVVERDGYLWQSTPDARPRPSARQFRPSPSWPTPSGHGVQHAHLQVALHAGGGEFH